MTHKRRQWGQRKAAAPTTEKGKVIVEERKSKRKLSGTFLLSLFIQLARQLGCCIDGIVDLSQLDDYRFIFWVSRHRSLFLAGSRRRSSCGSEFVDRREVAFFIGHSRVRSQQCSQQHNSFHYCQPCSFGLQTVTASMNVAPYYHCHCCSTAGIQLRTSRLENRVRKPLDICQPTLDVGCLVDIFSPLSIKKLVNRNKKWTTKGNRSVDCTCAKIKRRLVTRDESFFWIDPMPSATR